MDNATPTNPNPVNQPVQQPVTPPPVQQPVNPTPAANNSSSTLGGWPGAFGIFKYSKTVVMLSLGTLILLYISNGVISYVGNISSGAFYNTSNNMSLNQYLLALLVQSVILLIGSTIVGAAQIYVYLEGLKGVKTSFIDSLSNSIKYFFKYLFLNILLGATAIASLMLFTIPFFFIFPRIILAPYFLIDQNLGVIESYKASWNSTRGNVGKVYGIFGAIIVMLLPIITVIGAVASVYFIFLYSASFAILYKYVKDSSKVTV
jgi:hypothetical protein